MRGWLLDTTRLLSRDTIQTSILSSPLCVPFLRSRDSYNPVPCKALLYSAVGAKFALLHAKSEPNGIDIAVAFFTASFLYCVFAALFAMSAKRRLANYSLHKGESLIERCRDRQRKFDALNRRQFDLFLRVPVTVLLIAFLLLLCGLCQRIRCLNPSIPYILIPLAMPGIAICLGIAGIIMTF